MIREYLAIPLHCLLVLAGNLGAHRQLPQALRHNGRSWDVPPRMPRALSAIARVPWHDQRLPWLRSPRNTPPTSVGTQNRPKDPPLAPLFLSFASSFFMYSRPSGKLPSGVVALTMSASWSEPLGSLDGIGGRVGQSSKAGSGPVQRPLSFLICLVTEGWLLLFPLSSTNGCWCFSWMVLITISAISTHFAIKFQYIVMAVIAISVYHSLPQRVPSVESIVLIGNFEDASFWQVFAVFFPAVTGIMAGANLSGDLKNPRKSIPLGTLSAIGVTLLIYVLIAVFAAYLIPMDVLRSNQMAMVRIYSRIQILVIFGILAATFSSALGSIIGAPRILQALPQRA